MTAFVVGVGTRRLLVSLQPVHYGDKIQLVHVVTGNILHTLLATPASFDVSSSTLGLRVPKYVPRRGKGDRQGVRCERCTS